MNTLNHPAKSLSVLRNAHTLIGHELRASDGIIGKVDDLYFDDQQWCLRYFVVETGGWLKKRRRVLISPEAIHSPEWNSRTLPVDLTKSQIRESPALEGDFPVSRQTEKLLREHYGWPLYWGAAYPGSSIPASPAARVETTSTNIRTAASTGPLEDSNLRSAREASRYRIHASDGEIGHAVDFLIDDRTWDIRYIVIDTKNWLPGKKVVVSPWWINEVNWTDSEITVDLTKDSIKHSPDYDPEYPLTADYLGKLYDHYGRAYPSGEESSTAMSIESPAFENGCAIPRRYTRYGQNRQPPLLFEHIPAETASLALLVDDPDAPKGTFTHWIAYNIDPHLSGLVENSSLEGAQEGLNDSGRIGYTGPFPPSGEHRYFFRLYALDCMLDLSGDVARETFLEALEGHVIAEAEYMGRFATPIQASRRK